MNIKELRKSRKLTQAAFARAINASVSTLTAIETGRKQLSEAMAGKVKEVFGVEVSTEMMPKRVKKGSRSTAQAKAQRSALAKLGKKKIFIQSPLGGVITPEEILAKVGEVDEVYVRVDENKAYWVKGKESGAVVLW